MYLPQLSCVHKQYLAAVSCLLSVMMIGTCFAWFTPLLKDLTSSDSDIPMTSAQSSWLVASIEIGEILSPIPAGILVNRWGRKATLLLSFPTTALSWVIVLTTRSYEALIVVRILQGVAMGIIFTVAPMYVAEIAECHIRGALCGLFQTFWVTGILYSCVAGSMLSYEHYAVAGWSISVLFFMTFIWAPESPYYYMMTRRESEARESLHRIRNSEDVEREITLIRGSLYGDKNLKKVRWKELITDKDNLRSMAVVSGVCFVKYMSGIVVITEYISLTVAETEGTEVNVDLITIGIGLVMLIASIASAYLSDLFGRKPLIIVSVIGAILLNAVTGTYYLLLQLNITDIARYSWIAYTSLAAYCIMANIGLSPLLHTLQAECFPSRLRGHAGAYVSCIGTVCIFLSLKQYQPIADLVGYYLNFYSFSVYAAIGSIVIFAFMKETAGKSLEEIQAGNKNKAVDMTIENTKF